MNATTEQQARRLPILHINDDERRALDTFGEWSPAMARACMERNRLNFDHIERINNHYENHRWGSDTDRRYRKAAVNRAIKAVAADPRAYLAD
nr:MAG TPA: hypothetical protein [Caudoviricetes sp.]